MLGPVLQTVVILGGGMEQMTVSWTLWTLASTSVWAPRLHSAPWEQATCFAPASNIFAQKFSLASCSLQETRLLALNDGIRLILTPEKPRQED